MASSDKSASPFEVIYAFPGDQMIGGQPHGSLTAVGTGGAAFLCGRTYLGGMSNLGAVFRIDTDGSNPEPLHSFAGGAHDGAQPRHDSMLLVDDVLYGMTVAGGKENVGTVFQIGTDGSGFDSMHDFVGGNDDGSTPHSVVTFDGTTLWGLTERGGTHNKGTLFRLTPDATTFQVAVSFHSSQGEEPHGTPHLFNGALYGMARKGGKNGLGVVFSYRSGVYSVVHSFTGGPSDGATPYHGNLVALGTDLYGLTYAGGTSNRGAIFRLDSSGATTALHSFAGSPDGSHPLGTLVAVPDVDAADGPVWLYGTTDDGGTNEVGTVFRIRSDGSGYEVCHSFSTAEGTHPADNLTICGAGLYGMTQFGGGTSNAGTIFTLAC